MFLNDDLDTSILQKIIFKILLTKYYKDMPAVSRVERKKEETKSRIITVAIGLFNEKGVQATTMEQIAELADIAKGTLY